MPESPRLDQADEILRFVEFWHKQTGKDPAELVFDSQLTTYANLNWLNQRDIRFLTLRRRSRRMLGEIFSRPASAWHRITLPSLTRTFRTPRVLDERIHLKDYDGPLRQITIIDLGHEEPTILLTNNFKSGCPTLVTRYAQRMLIENGISEAIQFFHLDALSSMVGLKVDFDLQITLMASSLYRLLADRIGREYSKGSGQDDLRQFAGSLCDGPDRGRRGDRHARQAGSQPLPGGIAVDRPAHSHALGRRSHPKSKCSVYNLRQETPEISQKSPSNEYHTEHFT